MPFEVHEKADGRILVVQAIGKLTKEDYQQFVPEVERLIGLRGPLRILFHLQDLHGWTIGAFWQDLKFTVKHSRHLARLAVVGDKAWEHGMAIVCRPFTMAKVRYFDKTEADQAEAWLQADLPASPVSGLSTR